MIEMRDIGAAIVGTGFVAVVHLDALRRLGVAVTGVVGSSPERAALRAGEAGLPAPYESFEAMLADPAVDVVHVASPNHVHFDQSVAALAAGKHVVCEKPLALDSTQTAELVRRAHASGLVRAVNFNLRFYPQLIEARERVAAGELGAVRLISGGYLQDWLALDSDWSWRVDPAIGGALRAVGDIGSHWVDLVRFITGRRVESVLADLVTFMPVRHQPSGPVAAFAASSGPTVAREIDSDDAAGLLLRLEGGARAVATISQVSHGRRNHLHFEVDGADGALAWAGERPEELWLGHRGRASETLLRDPTLMSAAAAAATRLPAGHAEGYADTFRELYRAVYRAVASGGPPARPDYPTFDDGHEWALVADAIATSAREGRRVAVARS